MNVEPAVIVGLSGFVPYGSAAVGLPLTLGSVIRRFGPADRSSWASKMPPGFPSSTSAPRTVSFASANGGSDGNMRPNEPLSLGAPACPPCGPIAPVAVPVIAATLETPPTDEAATPAAVTPKPAKNLRRDG